MFLTFFFDFGLEHYEGDVEEETPLPSVVKGKLSNGLSLSLYIIQV